VERVGSVTFSPPDGFVYQQPSAREAVALMKATGRNWQVLIALLPPFESSADINRDFAAEWQRRITRHFGSPGPRFVGDYNGAGYPGRVASDTPEGRGFVRLYLLRAHSSAIPVMVLASTSGILSDHSVPIEEFLDSIRISPDRPQPPTRTVRLSDLAGEWHEGGDSSVNWVDRFGNYAGTDFVAHGSTYVINADGTFLSNFVGIFNRAIIRDKTTGHVEIDGDLIVLYEDKSSHTSRYRVISYQEAPNGVAVLTLMPPGLELYSANIKFHGKKWYRRPVASETARGK